MFKLYILGFTTAEWGNVYDMVSFTKHFLCKIIYLVVFSVINVVKKKKQHVTDVSFCYGIKKVDLPFVFIYISVILLSASQTEI